LAAYRLIVALPQEHDTGGGFDANPRELTRSA
jgi:hypothetical protein